MCTVSIIVPVYNVEKYLRSCVDSILAQTFTDIEVLLVDDGSTDSSGAICDEYAEKDSRVRVFHKVNGGVSSARNLGLGEANGQWIMFLDSDDRVAPEICERLLECAEEGCMPMLGKWYEGRDEEYRLADCGMEGNKKYPIRDILNIKIHHPWDKLYEKSIIAKHNLLFDDISYTEDAIFNYKYYSYLTSFFLVDAALNYYRVLPNSLSHSRYIADWDKARIILSKQRMKLAVQFYADADYYNRHYKDYFFDTYEAFERNMRKDAPGSLWQKMRRNNKILRSDEFMKAYPYRNEWPQSFNKRYIRMLELSYHTGNYFWLWLLGIPGIIKEAIKRKK